MPCAPAVEALIPFFHRLTSGLALLVVIGVVAAGRRVFGPGSLTCNTSWASLGFVIAEALMGAGLVLFGWVAQDQPLGRAVSVSSYLVNTLLLIGAPSFAALAASVPDRVAFRCGKRTLAGIGAGCRAWSHWRSDGAGRPVVPGALAGCSRAGEAAVRPTGSGRPHRRLPAGMDRRVLAGRWAASAAGARVDGDHAPRPPTCGGGG